jgi:hypothetical protein
MIDFINYVDYCKKLLSDRYIDKNKTISYIKTDIIDSIEHPFKFIENNIDSNDNENTFEIYHNLYYFIKEPSYSSNSSKVNHAKFNIINNSLGSKKLILLQILSNTNDYQFQGAELAKIQALNSNIVISQEDK